MYQASDYMKHTMPLVTWDRKFESIGCAKPQVDSMPHWSLMSMLVHNNKHLFSEFKPFQYRNQWFDDIIRSDWSLEVISNSHLDFK